MLPWALHDESSVGMAVKRRRELEQSPDCQFVGRDEFMDLLTSSRNLVRADEEAIGVRGLRDVENDSRFLIDEAQLFSG